MRTTTTTQVPKNVTRLEKEVYASIKRRARFVGITIDELCRRAKIAPSTFSRWVNGHNSGLIFTIGQMDEILTALEAEKFHILEQRIHASDMTISGACEAVDIPVLDYTLSDTVSGSAQDFSPPEPEPQPEPKPELRDDEVTPARATPVEIIRVFDEAIVEVFGEQLARPWPHGEDAMIAAQFIAAGADRELCRQVFLKQLHSHHRKGKHPIGSLAYFRTAIPDAVKDRTYYQQNPIPEVNHDGTKPDASRQYAPRARSGHDAFTEALVEVVHERERD